MATNLTYLDSSTYCLCQCQCLTYLVEWITCDCDVISYLASFLGQFPPLMWPGYEAGCDVLMVPYHTQLPEVSTQELYADSRLQVWAITGKCFSLTEPG